MFQYEKIPYTLPKWYEPVLSQIEDLKDTLNITTNDLTSIISNDIAPQVQIEGNRLSAKEITYLLLEEVTIRGKKFGDFVQVRNEDFSGKILKKQLRNNDFVLSEDSILFLHRLVTNGELDEKESGHFRTDPVHIRYTSYIPPEPEAVPSLMKELVSEYNKPLSDMETIFERICEWKRNFERIHPFIDGNGRTGRLIMNLLFLQNGYGYIGIPLEERDKYFNAIEDNTLHEFLAPKMLSVMKHIQELHDTKSLPIGGLNL